MAPMKKALVVLLLLSSTAHAQPAKIDAIMKPWTGKTTPGCAVAVVQKGKVTHAKGYGMADLERKVPITPSTLFDIGSTSKQFTAANILMLAAEGKLALDDDIRKYLPELPALTKKPVTIRHLVHHTGGLRDYMPLLMARGKRTEDVTTSKETVAALARQKGVDFEPGAKFEYSNTGYFLLAQIAERADKRSMREQIAARIFKPSGMTASQIFDDHHRLIPGRALGYAPADGGGWRFDTSQWEQTGDGSVITSVLDLAKWDAHFYAPKIGGGGKALLDAQLQKGKLADGKELDYAAGLFHQQYREHAVVLHGGAWAGFRAELMRFPALRTSVIVLCNAASSNPTKLARQIAGVVLGKRLGPDAAPPPSPTAALTLTPAELDRWAGRYREKTSGEVIVVRREDTKLVVEAGGTHALEPTSKSVFRLGPSPFRLEFAGTAPKRTVGLRGPREENYVEVATYKPAAADVAALAGRYWSAELAVLWTIRVEKGTAVLDVFDEYGLPLEMTSKDELASTKSGIGLTLQRGPRGIRGFAASTMGLRGIVFERL